MRLKTPRSDTLWDFGRMEDDLFIIEIMLPTVNRGIVNIIVIIRGTVLA
jgi:hypothetical protein